METIISGFSVLFWSYLIGSIPNGYMMGKFNGLDIRRHGSKNIGATNVRRILGRPWGIACFILDFLKGLIPVMVIGHMIASNWAIGAGYGGSVNHIDIKNTKYTGGGIGGAIMDWTG